jgi:polysaccharide biosynthesis/export protein
MFTGRYFSGLAVIVVATALCLMQTNNAAAQTGSSAELEILRNLPPGQREAILDKVLGGRDAGSSSGTLPSTQSSPQNGKQTNGARPRAADEELNEAIPTLKAEDSLIVELDFDLPGIPSFAATKAPVTTQVADESEQARVVQQNGTAIDPDTLPPLEREQIELVIKQVRSGNPYRLSAEGVLYMPGFSGIPLAGLTEEKAALRLRSESALGKLEIRVTHLPLKGAGVEALKPFGYDLFDNELIAPSYGSTVAVPANYIVGPGDTLEIQLYGNRDRAFVLVIGRDGTVSFPELGPISVGGRSIESVASDIASRVSRQMIGVQANVTLGAVRGMQIFVLGEAKAPGAHSLNGLATVTSALYAAGGVTEIGSLRNIQVKRRGVTVSSFDLYDLLIEGDTSGDIRLQDGDAVFIPPVGATVAVDGEVRRPGIYEIRGGVTAEDLVALAGGLTAIADSDRAVLTRTDDNQKRVALLANLRDANSSLVMRNGDALRVKRLNSSLDTAIMLEGHVYAEGPVAWRSGLRLSQVIRSVDDLQPNADLHYVLIRRENQTNRYVSVLSADLIAALQSPGSEKDTELQPRDRVIVFDKEAGRAKVIGSLLTELQLQSNLRQPTQIVRISGNAKAPGEYPLEPSMRVSDLIRAGGSLEDAAFGGTAELVRHEVQGNEVRRTELIKIDLAAVLRGDSSQDLYLKAYDSLSIKRMPEWVLPESIEISGEVRFPGMYQIRPGETLSSVLDRAGGLSNYAFAEGSVFTRDELKKREQEQLNLLADRLQSDLSTLALRGVAANQAQAGAALSVGQSLLNQLRTVDPVGRLVINLNEVLSLVDKNDNSRDILLHGGDRLIVPKLRQEVMVLGEVQNVTSHLFRENLNLTDYIGLSGGVSRKADSDRIYVIRADGSVVPKGANRWFSHSGPQMRPGDTVVVPLDTERLPALPFWQAVTQILYNVAVSVAAVGSFR